MRHDKRDHVSRLAAAALVAAVVSAFPQAGRAVGLRAQAREAAAGRGDAPLAGVVKLGAIPVPGVELLVHGLSAPIAAFSRVVRTAADGTWVVPAAPAGLYAISSLGKGFRPAVARVWHRAEAADLSFVTLALERGGGVLPESAAGASDPWIGRAITSGDVLRQEGSSALGTPASAPAPIATASRTTAANLGRSPLKASVESTTGFGATNGTNLSATSVDLAGILGSSLRWGIEGQYRRLADDGGGLGNSSHVTLDVAPGDQAIRVSARRQSVGPDGNDPARFAAQALDWSVPTGDRARASVTARLVSESNLLQRGPVASLFARASNAFEVEARYRVESAGGTYVRFAVGYRSATGIDPPASSAVAFDRETHLGGTAGVQITRGLSLEAGATGDVSNVVRGVAPELEIAVKTPDGIRVYGFVSRRFERRLADGEPPLARAGTDEAGLSRLTRALYRGGVRWDDASGSSVSVEASQRELLGTYRLLLDPEFLDNLDSLYYLEGDVARELSGSSTFRISEGLQGRLSARAGRMRGTRLGVIVRDDGRWAVGQFAVRVGVTGTWVGVGYRSVSQELERSDSVLRNELDAWNFSLAQALPIGFLRALGTEWRALFSLELGDRVEGEQVARVNRRFSGGLALNF